MHAPERSAPDAPGRTGRNLLDLTQAELEAFVTGELGQPRFRADQIWQWLWGKDSRTFEDMTNLSRDLRDKLAARSHIFWPGVTTEKVSADGTIKFLLRMHDGELIETVLIPGEDRYTQCLSTQVGCAMACTFCSTGQMGFTRNLSMGEILGQVLVARRYLADHELHQLKNLVFMGMGEPLLNVEEVIKSLEAMKSDKGLYFSHRKVTVSSVGLPAGLNRLAETGLALPAISLHAPTQELRARIMPKAARVDLDELMACLDALPLKPRERITYEYLMLRDVNDGIEHAKQLVKLLGGRKCKVNLIAFNPPPDGSIAYERPDEERMLAFEKYLWDRNITCTIRRSMGQDIGAACGQLKAGEAEFGGGETDGRP